MAHLACMESYCDETKKIARNAQTVMPRSHIHGSPRRFYYGLNLTDDPGNDNFRGLIRMHYIRMIKYYYV